MKAETAKVVWPTRKETLTTAIMVVIMTSLLGRLLLRRRSAFSAIVKALLGAAELRVRSCPAGTSSTLIRASRTRFATPSWPRPNRLGLAQLVEAVEVPTEKVTEVRRGKKVTSDRKFFPGYVLAKLSHERRRLSPRQEHAEGHRLPRLERQAAADHRRRGRAHPQHQGRSRRGRAQDQDQVDYEIGDSVKVLDGPFASFNGLVEELDFDRGRVKVGVSIFGRATPVELEFEQVELVK